MSKQILRDNFPLLAENEGIWEGWYRHFDVDGNQIDAHRSKLVCRLPKDMPDIYHQTNHYTWDNGDTDIRDFKGYAEGNKMIFDNELINGWAAAVDLDEHNRTMMLHWERVGEPDLYLYEMIQVSDCRQYRTRVWQWLKDGRTLKRTLIDEHRTSTDWSGH